VSPARLDAAELALLARVAAVLLPADEPAGHGALEAALAASPGIADGVRAALAPLARRGGDLDTALADLVATDAVAAQELALLVASAHYAAPAVRAAIGYPGPQAIPLPPLPDAADAELEPLMARLAARGPSYRDA
jgi:hypothetical protein